MQTKAKFKLNRKASKFLKYYDSANRLSAGRDFQLFFMSAGASNIIMDFKTDGFDMFAVINVYTSFKHAIKKQIYAKIKQQIWIGTSVKIVFKNQKRCQYAKRTK